MTDKYKTYQIGEIAELTGLSHRALRYYEEQGLLDKRDHGPGRFRIYTERDLERINRIIRLKEYLGLSLQEAREALERDDERKRLMESAKEEKSPSARRLALTGARQILIEEMNMLQDRRQKLEELEHLLRERLREVDGELDRLKSNGGRVREEKNGSSKQRL